MLFFICSLSVLYLFSICSLSIMRTTKLYLLVFHNHSQSHSLPMGSRICNSYAAISSSAILICFLPQDSAPPAGFRKAHDVIRQQPSVRFVGSQEAFPVWICAVEHFNWDTVPFFQDSLVQSGPAWLAQRLPRRLDILAKCFKAGKSFSFCHITTSIYLLSIPSQIMLGGSYPAASTRKVNNRSCNRQVQTSVSVFQRTGLIDFSYRQYPPPSTILLKSSLYLK